MALRCFSAENDGVHYGKSYYRLRRPNAGALLQRLFEGYRKEGRSMPYTMADFMRDYKQEQLSELTVEERLAGLAPEQVIASLSPEQRLAGLTEAEIQAFLAKLRARPASAQ